MFEDSLFASTARRNPRRGWAAVLSFGVQTLVLSVFVLVPLLYTDALPLSVLKGTFVVTAPVRASAPPAPEVHHTRPSSSNMMNGQVVTPIVIPPHAAILHDDRPVSGDSDPGLDIPGAILDPSATHNSAINTLLNAAPKPVAPNVTANRGPFRISHIDEGLLIHKVTPAYPKLALAAHQQGAVVLQATIGRDGTIQNLRYVSGPSLLIQAAIQAVSQWRYRPYILNNEPVEVETQITVNFTLGG